MNDYCLPLAHPFSGSRATKSALLKDPRKYLLRRQSIIYCILTASLAWSVFKPRSKQKKASVPSVPDKRKRSSTAGSTGDVQPSKTKKLKREPPKRGEACPILSAPDLNHSAPLGPVNQARRVIQPSNKSARYCAPRIDGNGTDNDDYNEDGEDDNGKGSQASKGVGDELEETSSGEEKCEDVPLDVLKAEVEYIVQLK
jgi:hypothetical protein